MSIYFSVASFYFLAIFGVYGFSLLWEKSLADQFNFLTQISDAAGWIFFNLASLFTLGSLSSGFFLRDKRNQKIKTATVSKPGLELKRLGKFLSLMNIFIILVLFFFGGYELISRSNYEVVYENDSVSFLFSYFEMIVGFLPVVGIFFWNKSVKAKIYGGVSVFLSVMYLFAVGTKFSAITLLLYLIASYSRDKKISIGKLFAFLFVPILFVLVLFQRLVSDYGVATIFDGFSVFLYSGEMAIELALGVIISPIYITAETLAMRRTELSLLLLELNPLPGSMVGWYLEAESQRVNISIPFNALGTLGAYSYSFVFIYGFISSLTVGLFEKSSQAIVGGYAKVGALAISFLHLGLVYQYNLRSSFRWIYYCLIICTILIIWTHVLRPRMLSIKSYRSYEA